MNAFLIWEYYIDLPIWSSTLGKPKLSFNCPPGTSSLPRKKCDQVKWHDHSCLPWMLNNSNNHGGQIVKTHKRISSAWKVSQVSYTLYNQNQVNPEYWKLICDRIPSSRPHLELSIGNARQSQRWSYIRRSRSENKMQKNNVVLIINDRKTFLWWKKRGFNIWSDLKTQIYI